MEAVRGWQSCNEAIAGVASTSVARGIEQRSDTCPPCDPPLFRPRQKGRSGSDPPCHPPAGRPSGSTAPQSLRPTPVRGRARCRKDARNACGAARAGRAGRDRGGGAGAGPDARRPVCTRPLPAAARTEPPPPAAEGRRVRDRPRVRRRHSQQGLQRCQGSAAQEHVPAARRAAGGEAGGARVRENGGRRAVQVHDRQAAGVAELCRREEGGAGGEPAGFQVAGGQDDVCGERGAAGAEEDHVEARGADDAAADIDCHDDADNRHDDAHDDHGDADDHLPDADDLPDAHVHHNHPSPSVPPCPFQVLGPTARRRTHRRQGPPGEPPRRRGDVPPRQRGAGVPGRAGERHGREAAQVQGAGGVCHEAGLGWQGGVGDGVGRVHRGARGAPQHHCQRHRRLAGSVAHLRAVHDHRDGQDGLRARRHPLPWRRHGFRRRGHRRGHGSARVRDCLWGFARGRGRGAHGGFGGIAAHCRLLSVEEPHLRLEPRTAEPVPDEQGDPQSQPGRQQAERLRGKVQGRPHDRLCALLQHDAPDQGHRPRHRRDALRHRRRLHLGDEPRHPRGQLLRALQGRLHGHLHRQLRLDQRQDRLPVRDRRNGDGFRGRSGADGAGRAAARDGVQRILDRRGVRVERRGVEPHHACQAQQQLPARRIRRHPPHLRQHRLRRPGRGHRGQLLPGRVGAGVRGVPVRAEHHQDRLLAGLADHELPARRHGREAPGPHRGGRFVLAVGERVRGVGCAGERGDVDRQGWEGGVWERDGEQRGAAEAEREHGVRGAVAAVILLCLIFDSWSSGLAPLRLLIRRSGAEQFDRVPSGQRNGTDRGLRSLSSSSNIVFVVKMASNASAPRVIVIGCGMSGLAAAIRLKRAGHSPLILEATDHVGGRTYTVELGDGTPVDFGGSWIQGAPDEPAGPRRNPLFDYADGATFNNDERTVLLYPETTERVPPDTASWCFRTVGAVTDAAVRYAKEHPAEDVDVWSWMNRELDRILATEAADRSEKNLKLVRTMLISRASSKCCDADEMALLQMNVDGPFRSTTTADSYVVSGYRTVVNNLIERNGFVVGRDILLSTPVESIDYSQPGKVVLRTRNPAHPTFEATHVLCTIPLGALKWNSFYERLFTPPLPAGKRRAIEDMGIGLLNKTYLRFEEPWWDADVEYFQTYVPRSLWDPSPRSTVSKPPHAGFFVVAVGNFYSPRRPVLGVFSNATYAWWLEKLSDDECRSFVMGELRRMFADRDVPEPVEMKRTSWGHNEFYGGAYSHVKVHSGPWPQVVEKLYGQLREPLVGPDGVRRVFFAGEHTHEVCFSWVHGGYLSGDREGERMVEELRSSL